MILALGAKGPEFDSRNAPSSFLLFFYINGIAFPHSLTCQVRSAVCIQQRGAYAPRWASREGEPRASTPSRSNKLPAKTKAQHRVILLFVKRKKTDATSLQLCKVPISPASQATIRSCRLHCTMAPHRRVPQQVPSYFHISVCLDVLKVTCMKHRSR